MTRQLEAITEERTRKRNDAVVRAIEFELSGSIGHAGGEFTGFSAKVQEWETLLTIKAIFGSTPRVTFVASDTLSGALIKTVRLAYSDRLRWKEDKWAPSED